MKCVAAISFDLDGTLWPVGPVIRQAEHQVYVWLAQHCPRVTQRYGLGAMRRLRDQVAAENPRLRHDVTAIRQLALRRMFRSCDYPAAHVDAAYAVFVEARNRVRPFPEVLPVLHALHGRFPLVTITNGNADLKRIGIDSFFEHSVSARLVGAAKPRPDAFLSACRKLNLNPKQVVHVGDHPEEDVLGAARIGMQTVWLNRQRGAWLFDHQPDAEISLLSQLLPLVGLPTTNPAH